MLAKVPSANSLLSSTIVSFSGNVVVVAFLDGSGASSTVGSVDRGVTLDDSPLRTVRFDSDNQTNKAIRKWEQHRQSKRDFTFSVGKLKAHEDSDLQCQCL